MVEWVLLDDLIPPHRTTNPDHTINLANSLASVGWKGDALVGYPSVDEVGAVQLLLGTHRLAAARMAGFQRVPVHVWERESIIRNWGTDGWRWIMEAGSE